MKGRFDCTSAWAAGLLICIQACITAPVFSSTADHSKFTELQTDFSSGPEVTRACLTCHTEAAAQIHQTRHWTWTYLNPGNQQQLGKRHILNNFCITPQSNYDHCTGCHIGYGWSDESFDFTVEENVDCLVCHDTSGTYFKAMDNAGHPRASVDLKSVAQSVGKTSRDSCGACHFYGGGGDGVKHGDLDSSLAAPGIELDVHMDALGEDFTCATCHATRAHDIAGSRYAPEATETGGYHLHKRDYNQEDRAHCRACHGGSPHKRESRERLNHHAEKIACQTCHIPRIARGGIPTRMQWDWSTAGNLDDNGEPIEKKVNGRPVYLSGKGSFSYAENIRPEYMWFNGSVSYQLLSERITLDEDGYLAINKFEGSPDDGRSRIWPVKVFRGVQPYDPELNTLLVPHTAGHDEFAYWENFDWDKALSAGMDSAGLPYSGNFDFVNTRMLWPITHMVAPAAEAVQCDECHRKNGRLAAIDGIYIPGRNADTLLDRLGWLVALATLLGVFAHALGRLIAHLARRQ